MYRLECKIRSASLQLLQTMLSKALKQSVKNEMTFEVSLCLKILRLGARSFRSQEDKYTIHVTHKNNCRTNQTLKSTYSL